MLVFRVVGLVAVLASLAACAGETGDTTDGATTSKSVSDLSDPGGMGNDVPVPELPPGPWNDPDWKPPPTFGEQDREHDPVGPEHRCGLGYLKIYDPARSRDIEVPIVICE